MCLRGLSFPLQMHLVLILHVVAFEIVLINALSVVVQHSFEDPAASSYTRGGGSQQDSLRLIIKARKLEQY